MLAREKRHKRIEDAEKRRQYRVAHGLEAPAVADSAEAVKDDQSPIAAGAVDSSVGVVKADAGPEAESTAVPGDYRDFEGKKRPVKKWLGIW